jgi:hypothetical protein
MEREQRLVIAGDAEHGDRYLARMIDDSPRGHEPKPNPIVEIISILSYPMQRAISMPGVCHETPPLREGTYCRLEVLQDPAGPADALPFDQALRACQEQALSEARSEGEREIIRRHMDGDVRGQRAVVTFKRWEVSPHPSR